jgi:membrane protease YdiL (CAAX protease family)
MQDRLDPPQITLKLVIPFYFALCLAAWTWAFFDRGSPAISLIILDERLMPSTASALGFAAAILALTPWILRRSKPMRALTLEIREMLGPLPRWKILTIAVASGFGEEIFFRGAMQSSLGLLATSLIFGILHGFPGTRFAHWGIFAFVAGLGFGLLQHYSGSVFAAFLAHMSINYWNLCRIIEGRLDSCAADTDSVSGDGKRATENGPGRRSFDG